MHEGGWLILIYPSTATTAVDDEGCIAVWHLERTGVDAVTFCQGDGVAVEGCCRCLTLCRCHADGDLGTLCDFSSAADGITSYGDTGASTTRAADGQGRNGWGLATAVSA